MGAVRVRRVRPEDAARVRALRLEMLADIWGKVYLFHPRVVTSQVDWARVLVEAIPRVEKAANTDELVAVQIVYELHPDKLVVEVADDGEGFEPPAASALAEEEELTEGGLGIAIIRAVADEVEIGRGESGGSRLRFVKFLDE